MPRLIMEIVRAAVAAAAVALRRRRSHRHRAAAAAGFGEKTHEIQIFHAGNFQIT